MPTRLIPTVDDRATPNAPFADLEFLRDFKFGEAFDFASFVVGNGLGRADAITPSTAMSAAVSNAPSANAFVEPLGVATNAAPALAGLVPAADERTSANLVFDTENAGWISSIQPLLPPVRAAALGSASESVSITESATASSTAAVAPAASPVSTIQGGPLIVQLDPVRGVATPIAEVSAVVVSTAPSTPITASVPGFSLEWAPVLEPHGGAASAQLPLFETGQTSLADLHALPLLPPITPPSGDGLGA